MKKFYDTNAILNLQDKVLVDDKFYISVQTLLELEEIKVARNKDDDVKYRARKVLHMLTENEGKYEVVMCVDEGNMFDRYGVDATPDNIICYAATTLGDDVLFVTDDLACRMIASNVFGLNVAGCEEDNKDITYKGYIDIKLNEADMAYFYEHQSENMYDLIAGQYIIIRDEDDKVVDTLKWNGTTYTTVRTKTFKSNDLGSLKPFDEVQVCAMDSLMENDITVLYGKAGSGKTTIPLHYIMQCIEKGKFKKLYVIYSYETLKGAKTLGYEKGDHLTKILLSGSIGNILASKFGDISQIEYMINRGMLEIIPTANIRGMEIGADSILMTTESQNMDVYTMKTVIQRCKEGCKIIVEGDYIEQSDSASMRGGMQRLIEVFKGHSKFGCVKLKNNYRSEFCKMADMM